MAKLRVGIVGCGGIMRGQHMPGWKEAPECEVVAACDSDPATLERFARDFAVPHACADLHALVARDDIDVVDIATPNRAHTPAVLAALAHGKHVLCEKPLAVTTAEVRAMAEAARAADRILMTAQHMRWSPSALALRRVVDAGSVGQVYHARVHALRRNLLPPKPTFIDDAISGGGPCMDIGVHALDLALWLMGFPQPVRVTGTTRTNFAHGDAIPGAWGEWDRARFTVEDNATGFVHFADGATLVLEAAWLQHQKEREDMSVQLYGRAGSIGWPGRELATTVNRALVDGTVGEEPQCRPAHTAEILAFVRAIREQAPSPVPVDQTLQVIAVLEAIVRSGREGREIIL